MVDQAELRAVESDFLSKHQEYRAMIGQLPLASPDATDNDALSSVVAEGVFLRYFTMWERTIEGAFLYFCQGGIALNGLQPSCRLANCDRSTARKILIGGGKFLDWSDHAAIRERAQLFFDNGRPFHGPLAGKAQPLSDARKVRNVIAHDSLEAWNTYQEVQRNNYYTEPNFRMPPGHMLRTRMRSASQNWGETYLDHIAETFAAIVRPT